MDQQLISSVGERQQKAARQKDIIDQIKDLYQRKGHGDVEQISPLNPTRAAMFGLDCRFKIIEGRLNLKKITRSAF